MTYRPQPWIDPGPISPWRAVASAALAFASQALAALAQRAVAGRGLAPERPPVLEFYAEAGAPEGALYIDGELVGRLHGVNRL